MTQHDRDRMNRALACDVDSLDSLDDAIRGLQSTDDPSLVPLHDTLLARWEVLRDQRAAQLKKGRTMTTTELGRLSDVILAILDCTETSRHTFEHEAKERGITLNQLIAAAIAVAVDSFIEGISS